MTDAEPTDLPPEIAALTFEAALKALEDVVRRLESGDVDLEASIDLYGRGVLLKRHCEAKLNAAQSRVEQIVLGADGAVTGRAFDVD